MRASESAVPTFPSLIGKPETRDSISCNTDAANPGVGQKPAVAFGKVQRLRH
jgi:hypothetical protein